MGKPTRRTMTLADLLVLVGTAAVGMGGLMAVDRLLLNHDLGEFTRLWRLSRGWDPKAWLLGGTDIIAYLMPLLGGWSVILPVLRLRAPRPRLRRALGQPGIVACVAAFAGVGFGSLGTLVSFGLSRTWLTSQTFRPFSAWLVWFLRREAPADAGLVVLGAWLGLALAGRWHRPVDWIDRLGRVLGVGWIVAGFVWVVHEYLPIM